MRKIFLRLLCVLTSLCLLLAWIPTVGQVSAATDSLTLYVAYWGQSYAQPVEKAKYSISQLKDLGTQEVFYTAVDRGDFARGAQTVGVALQDVLNDAGIDYWAAYTLNFLTTDKPTGSGYQSLTPGYLFRSRFAFPDLFMYYGEPEGEIAKRFADPDDPGRTEEEIINMLKACAEEVPALLAFEENLHRVDDFSPFEETELSSAQALRLFIGQTVPNEATASKLSYNLKSIVVLYKGYPILTTDEEMTLELGADGTVHVGIGDSGNNNSDLLNAVRGSLKWTTSDPSIATVDENGHVAAHANGTVYITVYAEGYYKTDSNGNSTGEKVSATIKIIAGTGISEGGGGSGSGSGSESGSGSGEDDGQGTGTGSGDATDPTAGGSGSGESPTEDPSSGSDSAQPQDPTEDNSSGSDSAQPQDPTEDNSSGSDSAQPQDPTEDNSSGSDSAEPETPTQEPTEDSSQNSGSIGATHPTEDAPEEEEQAPDNTGPEDPFQEPTTAPENTDTNISTEPTTEPAEDSPAITPGNSETEPPEDTAPEATEAPVFITPEPTEADDNSEELYVSPEQNTTEAPDTDPEPTAPPETQPEESAPPETQPEETISSETQPEQSDSNDTIDQTGKIQSLQVRKVILKGSQIREESAPAEDDSASSGYQGGSEAMLMVEKNPLTVFTTVMAILLFICGGTAKYLLFRREL